VHYRNLDEAGMGGDLINAYECDRVETEVKYEGYIRRQTEEIEKTKKTYSRAISQDLDYAAVAGLRLEAKEKLSKLRPETVGQASRIGGVNPADIAVLNVYLERMKTAKEPQQSCTGQQPALRWWIR